MQHFCRVTVGKAAITSYSDSQAFFKAMGARKSGPGQYLVLEYMRLTEIMSYGTDALNVTGNAKLALKWIAAHKGVIGNERVDEEAKRAAQRESSLLAPMAVRLCLVHWINPSMPITQGMEMSRFSGMWIGPGRPPPYNSGYP